MCPIDFKAELAAELEALKARSCNTAPVTPELSGRERQDRYNDGVRQASMERRAEALRLKLDVSMLQDYVTKRRVLSERARTALGEQIWGQWADYYEAQNVALLQGDGAREAGERFMEALRRHRDKLATYKSWKEG